jgi:hypothetical protein
LSHSKERAEKNCLNCNAEVYGRYCHVCGQENTEPKESAWGLITHFFYDVTHFDGKFFSTLKYLAFKPGFLSKEYVRGRRASYLNPVRMYVFTSAIFFIIFFSVVGPDSVVDSESKRQMKDSVISALNFRAAQETALRNADTKEDSAGILRALKLFDDSARRANRKNKIGEVDTVRLDRNGWAFRLNKFNYTSVEQYDSLQKTRPPDERDGWFERIMIKRSIVLSNKYNDSTLMRAWGEAFIHQFPKLLFISLPIFALILRLLYIRRRKQFYYVDHGIFSIHLYIFSFIVLLISMGLAGLSNVTGWGLFNWLQLPLWFYLIYYDYKSMRNFYGQGAGKTLVKFLLLNMLAFISIVILFAAFFIFAAFQL